MKNTKKFAAMIAALTLSACSIAPMAMTASAATELTLKAPSTLPAGATIQESVSAYQVFTTTVTGSNKNTPSDRLMNITGWGSDVNVDGLISDMGWNSTEITNDEKGANKAAELINADGFDLNAFAKAVINNKVGNGTAGTYSDGKVTFGKVTFETITDGYYAISCTVKAATGDEHDAQSLGMLTVVDGDATQVGENGTAKIGLPQVMKKVKEDTHEVSGAAAIGSYTEADTTNGTYNDVADYDIGDAVPFKLYGTLPSDFENYKTYYYCFNDTLDAAFTAPNKADVKVYIDGTETAAADIDVNGQAITVKFDNLKAEGLNVTTNSVITVEYSAVLNDKAEVGKPGQENKVNLTYSNNPNKQGEGETGTTPDDKVKVYTYALEIEKTFFNAAGGPITPDELENGTYEQVVFNLSKDSTLKFSEYTGEGDYDYVVDENGSEDLKLTEVDGELVIRIKGLDDGTYTLTEKTAPNGFNKAADQTIVINAYTENDQTWNGTAEDETLNSFKWTVGSEEKEGDVNTALALTEVQNKKGSELPSTGGIGTTIFYLGGGAMVAVAGVFLITKKRMGKSEN